MRRWIHACVDSLVKWDKGAWQWHCLQMQTMKEAFCNLFTRKNVSIGCCLHTEQTILLEELQNSKCLWEDLNDEEHGTHKGYTNMKVVMSIAHGHKYGAAYNAIIYQCLISPRVNTPEYLLLLYASWCCFCQAVAVSYAKQVVKLMDSGLIARNATVDRKKVLATQILACSSCTTLLSPSFDPILPLYVALTTQISLMAFIKPIHPLVRDKDLKATSDLLLLPSNVLH